MVDFHLRHGLRQLVDFANAAVAFDWFREVKGLMARASSANCSSGFDTQRLACQTSGIDASRDQQSQPHLLVAQVNGIAAALLPARQAPATCPCWPPMDAAGASQPETAANMPLRGWY